jgi:hypothetical protein
MSFAVGSAERAHRPLVIPSSGLANRVGPDAAIVIFHRREQPRQNHRRIRRPVAVNPAVELHPGSVHGHVDGRDAAGAEDDGLPAVRGIPTRLTH